MDRRLFGVWTMIGSYAAMVLISYHLDGYRLIWPEIQRFLMGRILEIERDPNLYHMLAGMFALATIGLPSAIITGLVSDQWLGRVNEHAVTEGLLTMKPGAHFPLFMAVCVGEELVARLLFLGGLASLPLLRSAIGHYLLFLIGNGLWSYMHLKNYENKDRHWMRASSQWVGGFFFTIAYLKYGFTGALCTHFAYNAVLISIDRKQRVSGVDALQFLYAAAVFVIGYFLMRKPLSDTAHWFDGHGFSIPGWNVWDYVSLAFFVGGSIALVLSVLFFDENNLTAFKEKSQAETGEERMKKLKQELLGAVPAAMLGVLVLWGLYKAAGIFSADPAHKALLIAVIGSFASISNSGSGVARSFWMNVPISFIQVAIVVAQGYWAAVVTLVILLLAELPRRVLAFVDD